jgi:hypothetical protein
VKVQGQMSTVLIGWRNGMSRPKTYCILKYVGCMMQRKGTSYYESKFGMGFLQFLSFIKCKSPKVVCNPKVIFFVVGSTLEF